MGVALSPAFGGSSPRGGAFRDKSQKFCFPISAFQPSKAPPLGELREAVRGQITHASHPHFKQFDKPKFEIPSQKGHPHAPH